MQNVAVIFGGRSAEHDISIITALGSVIRPLELLNQYHIEAVYIAKDGSWHWSEQLKKIELFSSGKIDSFLQKDQPASVLFDGNMTLVKKSGVSTRKVKIDIVFPAMHGTYGEDGSLMGLLEMANVPYVGCGVAASTIAMDKVLAKLLASSQGVPVVPFVFTTKNDLKNPEVFIKEVEVSLKYPVFVKPAHLGSSIGISVAKDKTELANALEVAAHYDNLVLVEEAVPNLIEVTLPIMGNESPVPALLEQPLTKTDEFFDFDTKYMQGGKKGKNGGQRSAQGYSEVPAKLPKTLYDAAEKVALDTYKAIGCEGFARVDLLINSNTSKIYFNELNPMPGSLYAHNWRAAGVSGVELVQKLINYGLERYKSRQELTTTFSTNYLKQF